MRQKSLMKLSKFKWLNIKTLSVNAQKALHKLVHNSQGV